MTEFINILLAALLVGSAVLAWLSNLLALPGNWLIPLAAAGFAWTYAPDLTPANAPLPFVLGWGSVGVLVVLACLGEVCELWAGSVGAARQGASRRAMLLSLVAAVAGSFVGAALTSGVLPIVGTLLGALLGGSAGAFGGGYLGEWWKGRSVADRISVGHGAVVGRVLGMMSKFMVGAVMVAVLCAALWF